jgi:hypothetical protein
MTFDIKTFYQITLAQLTFYHKGLVGQVTGLWVYRQNIVFVFQKRLLAKLPLDSVRSMHRSLWDKGAHSSFIEGLHTTKNMASVFYGF